MSEHRIICNCEGCHFRMAVFDSLNETEINTVCEVKKELEYSRGETIIAEGSLYLVREQLKEIEKPKGLKLEIVDKQKIPPYTF